MVEGILELTRGSASEIWVAIPFPDVTSFIEKIEQTIRDALGSLSTILTQPDECRPVPGPWKHIKQQPAYVKLPLCRDKPIEINQILVKTVAHTLDAIERDSAHSGEAG